MNISDLPNVATYIQGLLSMRKSMRTPNGFKFNGFEQFVLTYGLPLIRTSGLPRDIKKGPVKQCYQNATRLMSHNNLIYCEGFAFSGLIVTMHAWNLDDKGNVIDNTWCTRGKKLKMEATEYLGIPFSNDFVFKTIRERTYYGVIDDWSRDFPLLTGNIKPEEFLHPDFKDQILARPNQEEELMKDCKLAEAWEAAKELVKS